MPGVLRNLIKHSLNVNPKATPKRQHLRHFVDDRRDAIKKELAKLLAAGFIREVFHPEWPSIPEPAPTTTDPAPFPAGQEVIMIDVDWRQPFIDYICKQKVPTDKNLAEQLIRRAKSYVLVGDKLYRRGASSGVLKKCVPPEEGNGILEEIHKGVCGNHASSRTLVSNAFRRAFY
jgi:hypothetical protein